MPAVVIKVTAHTARVQSRPVNRIAITPARGGVVVLVPAPGRPGPPGDTELSPAERAALVADVADEVAADLTPLVSLPVQFQNALT